MAMKRIVVALLLYDHGKSFPYVSVEEEVVLEFDKVIGMWVVTGVEHPECHGKADFQNGAILDYLKNRLDVERSGEED
jgi:hypothetical protein